MKKLHEKRRMIYFIISFVIVMGVCVGYIRADFVSACAKRGNTSSIVRTKPGIYQDGDLSCHESGGTGQFYGSGHGSARSQEDVDGPRCLLLCPDLLTGSFRICLRNAATEEYAGDFCKEEIVQYLHRTDGDE